jgi:hypothetical protein
MIAKRLGIARPLKLHGMVPPMTCEIDEKLTEVTIDLRNLRFSINEQG